MNLLVIVSNIIITVCYWWIPLTGIWYWKTHRDGLGKHKNLLLWFTGFIFAHGMTRVFYVLSYYYGVYDIHVGFLVVTAVLSMKVAFHARTFMQDMVKLPSRTELHFALTRATEEQAGRLLEIEEKKQLIQEQERSIGNLRNMIETRMWIDDKDKALEELNKMMERMRA